MAEEGGSDDLEQTGGSTTSQLRAVKSRLKEEEIRAEYESKEQEKIEKAVYSTRARVTVAEKRLDRIEFFIGAVKWAAGPIVLALLGLVAEAIFGMIGG
jgi:hypothetical protein